MFISGIATIGQIQNVSIINAGSLSVSTISNVVSLVANTVTINQAEKVGKIVALQTQIQLGEGAQNVYIPVPSTVYNFYGMPGATLDFDIGTVDTFLVGTISAYSISFTIGTVQTFFIGSASADVMKFKIGTVENINITVAATGASLGFSAGSIGNITIGSVATIYNLNVANVGTINQLNVIGIGHIGTFDLDVGTIDSARIVIGTLNYATITATSVGTAYISISTISSCTITFGTITNLTAITENVSTLNVTVKGSISFATISAAGIGGLYVSSGTLASCTITSGRIGNLSVSASTITKLEITTPLIGRGVIRADNLVFLPYNWFPNPSFEYIDENGQVIDWTNVTRAPGGVDGNYYGSIEPETYAWARATLDIETGEILRFKGYVLSEWYPAFVAKVLDSSYHPIATLRIFTEPASNWEYRSVQMTISTQGAKHVVPGLYVPLYPAGFDCVECSKDIGSINIGDGQITTPKIAADAVQTSQIHFDPLSGSDPSDPSLTLWYRSDYDQLRFGGQSGQIGIVKRYPITEFNTPPENLVLNPFFEEDIDYDGVPDYWVPPTGSKNVDWGTLSPGLRGKRCVWSKISSSGAWKEWQSISVPVRPGQKLYARCYAKANAAYTPNIGILHIAWYAPDGSTFLDEVTSTVKGLTTSWDVHEVSAIVPADGTYGQNVRYARVHLYAGTSATFTTYYDDVVLSEQRAAVPTDGVVATGDAASGTSVIVPDQTWTTLLSYTVPNVDHEVLFCFAFAIITDSPGVSYPICGRLYNETDNIYYPVNSSTSIQETYYMPNLAPMSAVFFFTIPKNVKNKVLKFQIWHNIGSSKAFFGRATFWGHSPHVHR
jgi:hypothetical protein